MPKGKKSHPKHAHYQEINGAALEQLWMRIDKAVGKQGDTDPRSVSEKGAGSAAEGPDPAIGAQN